MYIRLLHAIAFTLFIVIVYLWLNRLLNDYANLAYGYTTLRLDINQMIDEGSLQIVDMSAVKQIMDVEHLDSDHFGDELAKRYSGMSGGWLIAAGGAWITFFALVYFSLFHWISLFRDRNRLKRSVAGGPMVSSPPPSGTDTTVS